MPRAVSAVGEPRDAYGEVDQAPDYDGIVREHLDREAERRRPRPRLPLRQPPRGHRDFSEPGCGRYFCGEHDVDHDCPNPDGEPEVAHRRRLREEQE
jgi:hypothetical protein